LRIVVSHPCDKNKDAARMGHPAKELIQSVMEELRKGRENKG
jgi:hypothetical protein